MDKLNKQKLEAQIRLFKAYTYGDYTNLDLQFINDKSYMPQEVILDEYIVYSGIEVPQEVREISKNYIVQTQCN